MSILEREGQPYVYSTKTQIDFQSGTYGTYRFGAFTKSELINFCRLKHIHCIVHASHPFAEELHQTIYHASNSLALPVIRFERHYPEKIKNELITYFSSYQEVMDHLKAAEVNNLLALTGVQTIEKLKPYWENHRTVFRILPRTSSFIIAKQAGFPVENLILEFPTSDLQKELGVLKKYSIQAILTKESGDTGFLSTKIEVALHAKAPLFIIQRNDLPASFIKVNNEQKLLRAISGVNEQVIMERSGT